MIFQIHHILHVGHVRTLLVTRPKTFSNCFHKSTNMFTILIS